MPVTGEVVGPAGVVLLNGEDHLRGTVRPNLEILGADLTRIRAYDKRDCFDEPLLLPNDIRVIEQAVDELENTKLVVVDPLSTFLNGNANSDRVVRRALGPLASLAEKKGLAVVIIRHWTKDGKARPEHRGSGSSSILALARSAIMIVPDPEGNTQFQHVLVPFKHNLATAAPLVYRTVMERDSVRVEWCGEWRRPTSDLFEANTDQYDFSRLEEACCFLYVTLATGGGEMPALAIRKEAEKAVVSISTLKRAKRKLRVRSDHRRSVSGNGRTWEWWWSLPADDTSLVPYMEMARECDEEMVIAPWNRPMIRIASAPTRKSTPDWHEPFLRMLPAIRQHARIAFRHLDPESREECIQGVICNVCAAMARLAEMGKLDLAYPTVLARYGVAQVRDGRMVGGKLNCKDPMSIYCRRSKGVVVERLDKFDEEENVWQEAVVQDTRTAPVPEIVRFKLDFADWLRNLSCRNRRIAGCLSLGNRTSDVAKRFHISPGRVSQLRRELKAAWDTFTGDSLAAPVPIPA